MYPKHELESSVSWNRYVQVNPNVPTELLTVEHSSRRLHDSDEASILERQKEDEFWQIYKQKQDSDEKHHIKKMKKHVKHEQELYANPGISQQTVHGLMIDAGSTGSRLHVFEWEPRILRNDEDIQAAVSGEKLSFPGTESRWTDRLRPGISTFSTIKDDEELKKAIAEYLQPLLDFAKAVLHAKSQYYDKFPIYLRATAGMRILDPSDRLRLLQAIRSLLATPSYNPFYFVDEHARVLSGEEEAVFDWTGVNFLMGGLVGESIGAGTVVNPKKTHGALDLGGSSTQISFYEPNQDIMANLFKLQIGQAKHWNVYAHSFLFYGMNEAMDRFEARLAHGQGAKKRLAEGIYNPCLPGGSNKSIRTNIHFTSEGVETWEYNSTYPSGDGSYQATLLNADERGNPTECMELTKKLLHLEENGFCNFAHKGDCSLAGRYQPELPEDVEFIGFSNYFDVWNFLKLHERATIDELEQATITICNMTLEELRDFNDDFVDEDELTTSCFRSSYVFQLLHNGYGFKRNDTIRVVDVLGGQKVGWALGSMIYEINTLPWSYKHGDPTWKIGHNPLMSPWQIYFLIMLIVGLFTSLVTVFYVREKKIRRYRDYQEVKDVPQS